MIKLRQAVLSPRPNGSGFPKANQLRARRVGTRYFRRSFTLPAGQPLAKATYVLTADNAFELSVNGKIAGQGDDWRAPVTLDVTSLLQTGANTIEITAKNTGDIPSPAGLIAKLHIEFMRGDQLDVITDAKWETTADPSSSWSAAQELGAYGMAPWGTTDEIGDRRLPARYLRNEFEITKKVTRATAYVCGLGFFDLFLNGAKVSDDVMDPALSNYSKAAYYVTFDVTDKLKQGANALGVILGNGRFFSPRLVTPTNFQAFGYPKLLLQLEVEYDDGTKDTLVSDEKWRLTTNGPIRANNEYDGEEYDARMEMPGWASPGFDDAKWEPAQLVAAPGGALKAQMIEPMRVTQIIRPVEITNPSEGTYIVDMGQNFYGTVRLKASAPAGTKVTMVSAYSLQADGTLKTADNRSARATDIYTFKGQGTEIWNPRFKGQGYRRIQVTGLPYAPTVDNFEGLVIHTDAEPVGEFQCSNDLINRIHKAMWWGMSMYMRSAPLDPDRDERQAWTGDPAKDAESEAYNYNVAPFYTKWMDDVERSQRGDGTIPDVAMYWDMGSGWNGLACLQSSPIGSSTSMAIPALRKRTTRQ